MSMTRTEHLLEAIAYDLGVIVPEYEDDPNVVAMVAAANLSPAPVWVNRLTAALREHEDVFGDTNPYGPTVGLIMAAVGYAQMPMPTPAQLEAMLAVLVQAFGGGLE